MEKERKRGKRQRETERDERYQDGTDGGHHAPMELGLSEKQEPRRAPRRDERREGGTWVPVQGACAVWRERYRRGVDSTTAGHERTVLGWTVRTVWTVWTMWTVWTVWTVHA